MLKLTCMRQRNQWQWQRQSVIGVLLLTVCALMVQGEALASASADESYAASPLERDNDALGLHKRPAFFVGSRYGRSSGGSSSSNSNTVSSNAATGSSKARRLIIVPRNDRFFLGSRYGKRNGEYLSPYEQDSLGLGRPKQQGKTQRISLDDSTAGGASGSGVGGSSSRAATMMMSCVYTGVSNFFRCSQADEINNIMNQLTGETMDGDGLAAEETK